MFIDLAKEQTSKQLSAEIAVVGTGPAGLSLALRLESLGHEVLLLESGGFEYSDAAQDLYGGDDVGGRNNYLRISRIRAFGGTSFAWAGWCAPLDPIDFERRKWIGHAGWPLAKDDLASYYSDAARLCELNATGFDIDYWAKARAQPALNWTAGDFSTAYFQLSPPTRFGETYRERVRRSSKITACLNATATRVRLAENGGSCIGIAVAAPGGRTIQIWARQYVLACGGIENARLLLISDDVARHGVGNDNDLVGRFFMDHPAFVSGAIVPTDPNLDLGFYLYDSHPNFRGFGTIVPTPALTERLRCINFNIELQPTYEGTGNSLYELKKDYWTLAGRVRRGRVLDDFGHNLSTFMSLIGNGASYAWSSLMHRERTLVHVDLRQHLECTPNAESRVTVDKAKKDRLGQPVTKLDWRVHPSDFEGWLRAQEALALAVGRSGTGRMRIDYDASNGPKSLNIESSWHHMGTTRMHASPKEGVVDASCRVHGVENLYLAGSSVFPTSGHANPTLTIVALALRLGDHLSRKARQ